MTLRAEKITFAYRQGAAVLRDVSLSIAPGSVTAIVGPNGAGKSTLLRVLAGVATLHSGVALLDDVSIAALPAKDRAARLAYVSQRPTLAGPFTVEQVVAMGRYALFRDDRTVRRAMEILELEKHRARPVFELSIGQQQRVAIARALAQLGAMETDSQSSSHSQLGGKALLADEPTAAMDPRFAALTMQLLRSLAEQGAVVGVALHDLSSALTWADRAVLLTFNGCVAAEGSAADILTPAVLSEVYDVPFELIGRGRRQALLATPIDPSTPAIPSKE